MAFIEYVINGFISQGQFEIIFKLILSTILGFGVGWNRRASDAGIRTFTLISLGATIFTVISIMGFPGNPETADHARIAAQIVTGVGFIGAGVIWKDKRDLRGLTTAASIWVAAASGIAVGVGMFTLAIIGNVITIIVLKLKPLLVKYEDHE